MLCVAIVDRGAEARNRVVSSINEFINIGTARAELLPAITLKSRTPQEIRFNGAPDICIVGPELVTHEPAQLSAIKKLIPNTPIVAWIPAGKATLPLIEQLARLGADEVIEDTISCDEFLKKLVLLARRSASKRGGTMLFVCGAKGGVGVTTVAAGLGEALLEQGKRVALIDLDCESQDLSRFLQVRPFVNENLQLLLDESRPLTQEFVEQSVYPVWQDEAGLVCMSPVIDGDRLYDARTPMGRLLISVLEILDSLYDVVIVDAGDSRGAVASAFCRAADRVLCVVNNDPAALYASIEKLRKLDELKAAAAQLLVLENGSIHGDLTHALLKDEIVAASRLDAKAWCQSAIPFSQVARRWPGSGETAFSLGPKAVRRTFLRVLQELELPGIEQQTSSESLLQHRVVGSRIKLPGGEKIKKLLGVPLAGVIKPEPPQAPLIGYTAQAMATKQTSEQGNVELDVQSLVSGAVIS